jgi:hypothetical protein
LLEWATLSSGEVDHNKFLRLDDLVEYLLVADVVSTGDGSSWDNCDVNWLDVPSVTIVHYDLMSFFDSVTCDHSQRTIELVIRQSVQNCMVANGNLLN